MRSKIYRVSTTPLESNCAGHYETIFLFLRNKRQKTREIVRKRGFVRERGFEKERERKKEGDKKEREGYKKERERENKLKHSFHTD